MQKQLVNQIIQDKYYDYLKENTNYIKELTRHPQNYSKIKEIIKDKYHLRMSDKISTAINDLELVSSVLNNIN